MCEENDFKNSPVKLNYQAQTSTLAAKFDKLLKRESTEETEDVMNPISEVVREWVNKR